METAASLPLQHHGTRIRFVAIGLDLGSPADKKNIKSMVWPLLKRQRVNASFDLRGDVDVCELAGRKIVPHSGCFSRDHRHRCRSLCGQTVGPAR